MKTKKEILKRLEYLEKCLSELPMFGAIDIEIKKATIKARIDELRLILGIF